MVPSCIDICRSLGPTSCVERGDLLHGQQLILHTTLPRLRSSTGEDTPASSYDVGTTREVAVTGSKPKLDWRRAWRQGLLLTVGEIIRSHWIATARLKLGSPQSVRCFPPWPACFIGCMELREPSRQVGHKTLHQETLKEAIRKLQLFVLRPGTLGPCVLD